MGKKKFEITDGNIADLPLIVEKAKVFNDLAKEAYGKFLKYDPLSVSANIAGLVSKGARYWVLWADDEFAGVILGGVAPNFYDNSQKVANCGFVAVLPEYQRTRWGSKLMDKFEAWGKESGAKVVAYGGYDNKFVRAMKHRGFMKTEVRMMKEI